MIPSEAQVWMRRVEGAVGRDRPRSLMQVEENGFVWVRVQESRNEWPGAGLND